MDAAKKALQQANRELLQEQDRIQQELARVRQAIRILHEIGPRKRARGTQPNRLSKKGREAISRAAKKRWAAYRRQQKRS